MMSSSASETSGGVDAIAAQAQGKVMEGKKWMDRWMSGIRQGDQSSTFGQIESNFVNP